MQREDVGNLYKNSVLLVTNCLDLEFRKLRGILRFTVA